MYPNGLSRYWSDHLFPWKKRPILALEFRHWQNISNIAMPWRELYAIALRELEELAKSYKGRIYERGCIKGAFLHEADPLNRLYRRSDGKALPLTTCPSGAWALDECVRPRIRFGLFKT